MRFALIIMLITVLNSFTTVESYSELDDLKRMLKKHIFKEHNFYRRLREGTSSLRYDALLTKKAQAKARFYSEDFPELFEEYEIKVQYDIHTYQLPRKFVHGENHVRLPSTNVDTLLHKYTSSPVYYWYWSSAYWSGKYNPDEKFGHRYRPFAQVVWKNTTKFGIGVILNPLEKRKKSGYIYGLMNVTVTCLYDPPGNAYNLSDPKAIAQAYEVNVGKVRDTWHYPVYYPVSKHGVRRGILWGMRTLVIMAILGTIILCTCYRPTKPPEMEFTAK